MRGTAGKRGAATVTVALLMLAAVPPLRSQAEPVRQRVLNEVTVRGDDDCSTILVSFNFPVRYMSHFPLERGTEVRVSLQPIAVNNEDLDALFTRETIVPPGFDDRVPIRAVVYEGDVPGGRFVTFRFDRAVAFDAGQGADFRSVQVGLPGPRSTGGCPPERE